ncbi:MAG: methionyl-tRNA formyltransferase [Ignavibacteria bacterium]|nr:methionyl-tRNA formyltransferase [Ignavibacteria bacterium]
MKITIITDDIKSWFIPYGKELEKILKSRGHEVKYINNKMDIESGDLCLIMSCLRILNDSYLELNKNNIVVHASDLPAGKGFSPMQCHVLEGNDEIMITLFEAVKEFDAGPYYLKEKLQFNGTELYYEMREKLGEKMIGMCLEYIDNIKTIVPVNQEGTETFYERRTVKHDELDIKKSIEDQINHFRVADNVNHPVYFNYKNTKYILKIYKAED